MTYTLLECGQRSCKAILGGFIVTCCQCLLEKIQGVWKFTVILPFLTLPVSSEWRKFP